MKDIKLLYLLILAVCLITSCETAQYQEFDNIQESPLLNFIVKKIGESSEYRSLQDASFNDGDTLYIKIPTTDEDPVDLSRLNAYASLAHNAVVTPNIQGEMDFTDVVKITVLDGDKVPYNYHIKVIPVLPKTVFKHIWFKNATDLGIVRTNISGMAVHNDHLFVADFNVWDAGDNTSGVRVYNKLSGSLEKIIPAPTTFTSQVCIDEAGHVLVNRYNIYGAGFMLYLYDTIDSEPELLLNYSEAMGCPVGLGRKISVIGNLKSGKAYVYATTESNDTFYYWEFNNGIPVNVIPTSMKYASAGGDWLFASIQRASLEDDSDHYLTFFQTDGSDPNREQGSRFDILTSGFDIQRLNYANHSYKILDFKVFNIQEDRFLAILEQGFLPWDAFSVKVFEITDHNTLEIQPGDQGYEDFLIFESDIYGGVNYNRWGDIDVDIVGDEAFIYATFPTNESATSGIWAYKMKYNKE
ncbi:hypothetical protein KCTC52924_02684 [Arenibacter antarcticus]|uniref:DUF5018 domain-containing protein n=1 Tax=Arenibacter antarcticus TaxID=2040469 RepID=A0ABW5VKF1_9FLAO|nr:DUF5018 domain-containing protein [Arenibacter sp. H213]MCM4167107.1 hypothetical protein [Arenibacter sp. H213]